VVVKGPLVAVVFAKNGSEGLQGSECLNWQPSHFINIVGKDDRATPACAGGGEEPIAARHSCRQVAPAWHLYFPLNSLILFFVITSADYRIFYSNREFRLSTHIVIYYQY